MQQRRGGGRQGWRNWKEKERDSRIWKNGGRDTEMNRRTIDDEMEILWIRHNVAHNPICTVPNAPLASAMGKEL